MEEAKNVYCRTGVSVRNFMWPLFDLVTVVDNFIKISVKTLKGNVSNY